MFVTNHRYECNERELAKRIKKLEEFCCEIWDKHERLLDHLGLYEHEIKQTKVIRKKFDKEEE